MSETDPREQAAEYFHRAYEKQMAGDYDEAIELYSRSLEAFPTAEAYTFRGWVYSFKGDLDRAIAECLEAIKVDPGFGNPYNDIGAYLIEKGQLDEAIPWLEKATHAPRYEAHCFPHFNLGRVYERKHNWKKAADCYRAAHDLNSSYTIAAVALKRLQTMWN